MTASPIINNGIIRAEDLRIAAASRPPRALVKCGMPSLDKACGGGFDAGEVYAVSGPTKHGKTTLLLTITRNLELMGQKTLWFSYEMPQENLFCAYTDLNSFVPALIKLGNKEWLFDRMREAVEKHGVKFVFIDHLHFVLDIARLKNISLEIGAFMNGLAFTTKELKVTTFLVAHIGKESSENPRPPQESDMRDSSFVGQTADSTILFHRYHKRNGIWVRRDDGMAQVVVSNHRRTGLWNRWFKVKKNGLYLEDRGQVAEDLEDALNQEDEF